MFDNIFSAGNSSEASLHRPVLKVIGMGGGGCNAVQRMIELGMSGVEFIAANTDHQALEKNPAPVKVQLGPHCTRGLGAGGNPSIGQEAAEESRRQLEAALQGADMVFLTAGMGGGTGTGSIPVAAEVARSVGAVAIAIVTMPFSFEMGRRQRNAAEGLGRLSQRTNTLIAIPNDRLLTASPRHLPMDTAFRMADDVLRQAVQGISELITMPGIINVDFAHIRRLILLGGGAIMSIGQATGEDKAQKALEQALTHPLLEEVSLEHAGGIIANFTGGDDLTLLDVQAALSNLHQQAPDAEIVMGVTNDFSKSDWAQVILVITGLGAPTLEEAISGVRRSASIPTPAVSPAVSNLRSYRLSNTAERCPLPQTSPVLSATPAPVPSGPAGASPSAESYRPSLQSPVSNLDAPAFLRRRPRTLSSGA